MIENCGYHVAVLPLEDHHRKVLAQFEGRLVSSDELLAAAFNYWRHGLYGGVMEESEVWEAVHEAVMDLNEFQQQTLAHMRRVTVPQALADESDELAFIVTDVAEDLCPLLTGYLGQQAWVIRHICRVDVDDLALYLSFIPFEERLQCHPLRA